MRRFGKVLIAGAISLALVTPTLATNFGIDLKTLSDAELTDLYSEVSMELSDRGLNSVSDIYPGFYEVGTDIIAGSFIYTASEDNTTPVSIEIYSDYLTFSTRNESTYPLFSMDVNPGSYVGLNLRDENCVLIQNGNGSLTRNLQSWAPVTTDTSSRDITQVNVSPAIPESGIRPEIKEAIDAYESFMMQYFDFMASYDSETQDYSVLMTYLQWMEDAATWEERFDALDGDLNDDETNYYIAASSRILQRELEVMYTMK